MTPKKKPAPRRKKRPTVAARLLLLEHEQLTVALHDARLVALEAALARLEAQMTFLTQAGADVFKGAHMAGVSSSKLDALLGDEQSTPVVPFAVRMTGRNEPLPDDVVVTTARKGRTKG